MDNSQAGSSIYQDVDSNEESEDSILRRSRKKRRMGIYDSDSSEINCKDSLESDIEDDERILEEMKSESVVSVVSESDNELMKGSDEEWTREGTFQKFVFQGSAGLKCLPNGPDSYNFFQLLFNNNFFSNIVEETNKYGRSKKADWWNNLTMKELKIFLGLFLHMSTIKCPQLQNYWSTQRLFNFNCFSQHMSKKRFQEILQCLHFSSNKRNNFLDKIWPIIDYFNEKMKQVYYPHKELTIDETIVPCKDRLLFQQYITRKRHECGIKLYVLTDSSGIALRMRVYKSNGEDINRKGHELKMVLSIIEDFLHKGHSIYTNKFYSSYELTKHLLNTKTYCTGALRRLRKGNNLNVIRAKLAKREIISRYKRNIMMGKFKDKRDIIFISSEFKADLMELENERKGKHKKPLALHKYEEFMNGVYKRDQMLTYYTCLGKTFKWYIKLWIHVVETLLFNSFLLYSNYSSCNKKINFFDYRLNIIDALLFENNKDNKQCNLSQQEHLPEILSRDEKNRVKRKRCRECFAKGLRKNTNYFCTGCNDNPGLCLGECFKKYHKDLL